MFNKNFKLILAVLIFAAAIWQFTEDYTGHVLNGIMLILLAGVFVFLYFKNEIILLAFLRLRKQDMAGAKKWLDRIKNPDTSLVKKQQGYYNYLNGLMVMETNMNDAEKFFKNAERLGLSMDTDMAMTKLNLAGIAMTKNRRRDADRLLAEAKSLDKHKMLDEQIKMMKGQMKKMGQPRQPHGRGGRGGRRY